MRRRVLSAALRNRIQRASAGYVFIAPEVEMKVAIVVGVMLLGVVSAARGLRQESAN